MGPEAWLTRSLPAWEETGTYAKMSGKGIRNLDAHRWVEESFTEANPLRALLLEWHFVRRRVTGVLCWFNIRTSEWHFVHVVASPLEVTGKCPMSGCSQLMYGMRLVYNLKLVWYYEIARILHREKIEGNNTAILQQTFDTRSM